MNTNNKNFVHSCFETFLLVLVIGVLGVVAAKAQDNNVDFEALNGLFTPTESARFFQAGRADFEREVESFNHPEPSLGDTAVCSQIEDNKESQKEVNNEAVFLGLARAGCQRD